jgi:hypothetical protein
LLEADPRISDAYAFGQLVDHRAFGKPLMDGNATALQKQLDCSRSRWR